MRYFYQRPADPLSDLVIRMIGSGTKIAEFQTFTGVPNQHYRTVIICGEAYIELRHQRTLAFILQASGGVITHEEMQLYRPSGEHYHPS